MTFYAQWLFPACNGGSPAATRWKCNLIHTHQARDWCPGSNKGEQRQSKPAYSPNVQRLLYDGGFGMQDKTTRICVLRATLKSNQMAASGWQHTSQRRFGIRLRVQKRWPVPRTWSDPVGLDEEYECWVVAVSARHHRHHTYLT